MAGARESLQEMPHLQQVLEGRQTEQLLAVVAQQELDLQVMQVQQALLV